MVRLKERNQAIPQAVRPPSDLPVFPACPGLPIAPEGVCDSGVGREGRNLFIAECKFWAGSKQVLKTIDQLLNYLTWRDCRAAILVFVRDTSMASVLEKVPETLAEHPNFQRSIDSTGSDEFRAKMKSARDKALSLDLAVQVYHVPNKDSEDAGGKDG